MSNHELSSAALFERARRVMPGGVNSPVRAFGAVGGRPRFIARAKGSRVWDVDGREHVDLLASWGPMLLGHAHPEVEEAVMSALRDGTSFGAATAREVELAEKVVELVPSIEMVRLVSSGTEATMTALRLARGATGRDRVLKFEGCYHGHADSFLIKSGSGTLTFGVPSSPGVPPALAELTLNAVYNDLDSVESLFGEHGDEIAAIIVEPVAGNMGTVPPREGFLEGLRELASKHGAILIFDEVITGFRVAPGGAQERFGVMPDLTTMGKVLGGGLPLGAIGGSRDLLEKLSPVGPVYQAGTLSGNPLATAAGNAVLDVIRRGQRDGESLYDELEHKGKRLDDGLRKIIDNASIPVTTNRVGSMSTFFFAAAPVDSFASLAEVDTDRYGEFFRAMLDAGVYVAPSQYEAGFVSTAHDDEDIDHVIAAVGDFFSTI